MTAGRARWCDHIPAVTAFVDCGGERHRVTWRRGKVVLEDHDLTAEMAMRAFGGEPLPCLGVLKRWRDMHTWAMSGELFRQMQARLGPEGLLPGDLSVVHELGLMLTWERSWRRSSYYAGYDRLLLEQVRKRALPPLRQHLAFWRQKSASRLLSPPQLELLRPGQAPSISGYMDKVRVSATAALGVAWVHRVWGRGMVLVDGAFVLDVEEDVGEEDVATDSELRVYAVRWEERQGGTWVPVAATASVGLEEGQYRLRWEDEAPSQGRMDARSPRA